MRKSVLALLEDDDNILQVTHSLNQSGHEITTPKNFPQAIEVLKVRHVDLIISDVHLQNGGNVFDFLRWVRRHPATKNTPFVMFSSKPTPLAKFFEDGIRTSARLLGAEMYITMEDFDSGEFCKKIDSLLPVEHPKAKIEVEGFGK